MRTLRGRLASWYAVALTATLIAFAVVLYFAQRRASFQQLDERLAVEAGLIANALTEAYGARDTLLAIDATGQAGLLPEVAVGMEGIPGLVAVTSTEGDVVYVSPGLRALPYASSVRLVALASETGTRSGSVDIGDPLGVLRFHVRPVVDAGGVAGIVTAAPAQQVEIGPRRLANTLMVIAPVILAFSVGIGYFLVGRTLRPVDRIVDEVEAISDGRSLHRRLAPLDTGDELARLTRTLNAMLARLERSFGSLRRFTADASHELKTPLTVLRGGIERSVTHPQTPPDVLAILDETLTEVNRMTEMVDSLLMLARADEGRAPLHEDLFDLRELLAEAAETASLLGEQAGVDVDVAEPSAPIVLAADQARIRQLLMNLLTNAIKYTPAGGKVAIGCRVEGQMVQLDVMDTGIGIAPGDLPHIFDRFWRADAARSRTGSRPGVGLGLAICQWIAEAHGGTIAVQSRPGRGTTFTVTLPLKADPVVS